MLKATGRRRLYVRLARTPQRSGRPAASQTKARSTILLVGLVAGLIWDCSELCDSDGRLVILPELPFRTLRRNCWNPPRLPSMERGTSAWPGTSRLNQVAAVADFLCSCEMSM